MGIKEVAVFSASNCRFEPFRQLAFDLGQALALNGFVTLNGGGPGLMDQVLRGAKSVGGATFAVRLSKHSREQSAFADQFVAYDALRPRQDALRERADAFVALPGGLGTLYEVLEIMALKNSGASDTPVLILLSDYFDPLLSWLGQQVAPGMVSSRWEDYFFRAKDVGKCIEILKETSN